MSHQKLKKTAIRMIEEAGAVVTSEVHHGSHVTLHVQHGTIRGSLNVSTSRRGHNLCERLLPKNIKRVLRGEVVR